MFSRKRPRKRLLVDPKVQVALVLRIFLYWAVCLLTVGTILFALWIATGSIRTLCPEFDSPWILGIPASLACLTVLGLIVVDMLRLSNRFVGPLVRLRRAMRALASGERVETLDFRDSDFWQEIAREFNAAATHVQSQRPDTPPQSPSDNESLPASSAG